MWNGHSVDVWKVCSSSALIILHAEDPYFCYQSWMCKAWGLDSATKLKYTCLIWMQHPDYKINTVHLLLFDTAVLFDWILYMTLNWTNHTPGLDSWTLIYPGIEPLHFHLCQQPTSGETSTRKRSSSTGWRPSRVAVNCLLGACMYNSQCLQ